MKIQLELNSPDPIAVNASIPPITFTTAGFHVDWEPLATMREVEPRRDYPASTFQGFLPRKAVSVGEYWKIDSDSVLQLLMQLAEEPQLELQNDEGGQWACLRAQNDVYAEVVFRIHTEFAFKDGTFTPSQLAGSMIIDRHQQELAYFEMSVPLGTLNFNAHRQFDDELTVTECGVCRIEMVAGEKITQELTYAEEIAIEEARLGLARQFYPAQCIEWVKLEEAPEMAKLLDRPIHVVSADGTFMDESC